MEGLVRVHFALKHFLQPLRQRCDTLRFTIRSESYAGNRMKVLVGGFACNRVLSSHFDSGCDTLHYTIRSDSHAEKYEEVQRRSERYGASAATAAS